jgi:RNA polymerase sigma-70 factor (ECF subfamily)
MTISSDILKALRDGSQEAYKTVYLQWRKPIYLLLLKLTGSDVDAEDITQDVFIKLWESREKVDPERDIRSLLYLIARRSAINYFDRKKTRDKFSRNCMFDEIDYENSYDIVVAKETELLKELALSRMSEQRSRIYRMNVEENLNAEEIAAKLGVSHGTVYNQISAAKKDLRELISLFMLLFIL